MWLNASKVLVLKFENLEKFLVCLRNMAQHFSILQVIVFQIFGLTEWSVDSCFFFVFEFFFLLAVIFFAFCYNEISAGFLAILLTAE